MLFEKPSSDALVRMLYEWAAALNLSLCVYCHRPVLPSPSVQPVPSHPAYVWHDLDGTRHSVSSLDTQAARERRLVVCAECWQRHDLLSCEHCTATTPRRWAKLGPVKVRLDGLPSAGINTAWSSNGPTTVMRLLCPRCLDLAASGELEETYTPLWNWPNGDLHDVSNYFSVTFGSCPQNVAGWYIYSPAHSTASIDARTHVAFSSSAASTVGGSH